MTFTLFACLLFFLVTPPLAAQTLPTIEEAQKEMKSLEENIEERRMQKESLSYSERQLLEDIERLNIALTKTAATIRKLEGQNELMSRRLTSLALAQRHNHAHLAARSEQTQRVASALSLLAMRPESATILGTKPAHARIRNAIILETIYAPLVKDITHAKELIEKAAAISLDIARIRDEQKEQHLLLIQEREKLNELIAQKQQKLPFISARIKNEESILKHLSEQAQNTQELIAKLINEQETQKSKEEMADDSFNNLTLPAKGAISQSPQEEGILIDTQKGEVILSPWQGVVIFASQFQEHENLIIIDHENTYHSVLGNLGSLLVRPGQKVQKGEPVGMMMQKEGTNLYYELREKRKPIDARSRFDMKKG